MCLVDSFHTNRRGSMLIEGTLTHPCAGVPTGKPAMVVVRVQGAPLVDII